jgi:hypothetical protein
MAQWPCHCSGDWLPASYSGRTRSIPYSWRLATQYTSFCYSDDDSDLYSGSNWFDPLPGHRLSWMRCRRWLQYLQATASTNTSNRPQPLPLPLQFFHSKLQSEIQLGKRRLRVVWSGIQIPTGAIRFNLMFVVPYTLVMFNSGPTRCALYSLFLSSLALHISGAICTHHQEHNCRVQP